MLKTLTTLPEVDDRVRFGAVNIGYDKVSLIRSEFLALQALAAFACACEVQDLTLEKVQAMVQELQQTQAQSGA
jgi:hypothetical protein